MSGIFWKSLFVSLPPPVFPFLSFLFLQTSATLRALLRTTFKGRPQDYTQMEAPAGLNEQQQILLGLMRQAAGPGSYPIQQIDQVCANLPPPQTSIC